MDISTQMLDAMVLKYKEHRDDYEEKKRVASEANSLLESVEAELLDMLEAAGKKKYFVDQLGTISQVHRLSYKMPKDPSEKQKLFGYISEKFGEETTLGLLTINHQSLNSFFKETADVIPGLEVPTSTVGLSFRKAND